MKPISKIWRRARASAVRLLRDDNAIAAVEFAVILPVMLVLFFGTLEFSSGIAADRQLNQMAHTLSDLTSQSPATGVSDADLTGLFAAGASIMYPYPTTPLTAVISELYVDSRTGNAYVQWSKPYQGGKALTVGDPISIPAALQVKGTYLIFSQVSYLYKPTVGYVMSSAGVKLNSSAYTRPRQANCVIHPAIVPPAIVPPCGTTEN
jgi:Flp pilus assembly protein TadG